MSDPDPEVLADLVDKAKKDRSAFGNLYDQFVKPVYRYLYNRVGSRFDAEDLTSETFAAALEGITNYQEDGHFTAWLYGIARHKLVDYYRRKNPGVPLDQVEYTVKIKGDHLKRLIKQNDHRQLLHLIQDLEDEEQELIYLRYVFGLTYVEIGKMLEKSAGAVKKATYRLLNRLKYQME